MSQKPVIYEFGPFRVDALKRVLLRDGEPIALTSKSFDTLLVLVQHRGDVVSKGDLMNSLWPDTIVEENNLTQQISMLRKVLGEAARDHRYIVTVPGRGYSFVAHVSEVNADESELIVAQHFRSRITVDVEDRPESLPVDVNSVSLLGAINRIPGRITYRTILAVGALAALTLLVLITYPRTENRLVVMENRSIAVLPFKVLNDDPANDYLSTGMADALIAKLSNIKKISVRPTSAIIRYANEDQNALAIGQELGVDSVLEGTVQTVGDKIRVTVQLVSIRDRNPLWARTFDEKTTDLFSLQNTISEQVAQTMLLRLDNDEQRKLRKQDTESVQAYQEYVRGRYFWNLRNEAGLLKSVDHFQKAIELDPRYGLAHAGLADAYTLIAFYCVNSVPADSAIQRARAATLDALRIDESLAEAHASLGLIKSMYDHDEIGAEYEFKRALELNPNYATGHHWYSEFLFRVGQDTKALAEIVKAQELDPLSPIINTTLGERLYFMRRYDESIIQLRRTLEIAPDFGPARFALALSLEQKGMFQEAITEFQKAQGTNALNRSALASLGHAYGSAGQKDKARKVLHDLLAQRDKAPFLIAIVYQGLGEKDQVLEWLSKLDMRINEYKSLLLFDPRLDTLRSETRFRALVS